MHRTPQGTAPQPSQCFLQQPDHQFVQHGFKLIKPLLLDGLYINGSVLSQDSCPIVLLTPDTAHAQLQGSSGVRFTGPWAGVLQDTHLKRSISFVNMRESCQEVIVICTDVLTPLLPAMFATKQLSPRSHRLYKQLG